MCRIHGCVSPLGENLPGKIANMISQQRTVAKTLAMLLQRRMEILNQLETIVGKQSPQIKTVTRRESHQQKM